MCTQLFDVKQDYVFKKIFGSESHPNILISFLNACFKGQEKIKSVKINNSKIEKEFIENSYSRLDILATTDTGEIINVEMQRRDAKNMVKRSLYYWAKTYSSQYKGKQEYENIPRTVCINILEYNLEELKNETNYHNVFRLKNEKTNSSLTNTLEIQFIELPKLVIDDSDLLSLWSSFIDDANSVEVIRAENVIEEIHEAREELARLSRDPNEAEKYRQREDAMAEKTSSFLSAKRIGLEEGKLEEKKETIKSALEMGMDMKAISILTKLSIIEVEAIVEELNDRK